MAKTKKPSYMAEFERYAGGRRHFALISMILAALSAVISSVPFYYTWLIVKEVLDVQPHFELATDVEYNAMMAVLFAILSITVYILAQLFSHLSAFRISTNIKIRLVEHVLTLSLGSFDKEGSGRVRRTVQDSVDSTHEYIAHTIPDMAATFALPVVIICLLFVFDWRLGLASLIPVILGFLISLSLMGRKTMQEDMREWQEALSDVNNQAVEYVRGISVVKVFQQTVDSFQNLKRSIVRYGEYCENYTKHSRGPISRFFSLVNSCSTFIVAMAVVLIVYCYDGVATPEFLANTIFYLMFTPLISVLMMRIMLSSEQINKVEDALTRINELLSMKPLEEPSRPVLPEEYTISFKDVSYTYEGSGTPAVDGVTLEMKQGTITALVGASGSGKSTLAGLAARFWDPQTGTVTIGGVDLRDIGSENVGSIQSYVFQNNHLIKGTLLDNVRLGRPEATTEEVRKALSTAQCDDLVAKLPQGLDTLIGPGGTYLSGGEVQRISVARAIVRDAPIVILDEATAFVDPENEHLIQKALEELSRGRTVLLIAHRLTTVRNADLICVMDRGRIVESGTHDELVAGSGKYCDMWNNYQKALSWRIRGAVA